MNEKIKEPLIRISRRDGLPTWKAWLIRTGAIIIALLVCALVTTLMTGENPLNIYATIFHGAFGTPRKIWMLCQNLAILLCISLAVTPAFKMRFWNIGAEGQVLIGGLATAATSFPPGSSSSQWQFPASQQALSGRLSPPSSRLVSTPTKPSSPL